MTGALGSMVRGVAASALGTLVFDAFLYRRYRHQGGDVPFPDWESSKGLESWDQAPAPALVGKKVIEFVSGRELSPRYARSLNNFMHWAYGSSTGAGYALVAGSRGKSDVWYGLPFGATVWASGYVVFPLLGVYEPIWKYDLKTLWKDLSGHLVFGAATAAAFKELP